LVMRELVESKDTTLIVKGPAKVEVEGRAEIFGCDIEKFFIEENRTLPLYLVEDSRVRVSDNSLVIPVRGNTIPNSWNTALKLVEDNDVKSIFIFGQSDSGKSSLATYLSNKLNGLKAIVDLDIGQASIAHPGAMGIGLTDGGITSVSDVRMFDGAFTGTISPMGRELRCLNAVLEIKEKLERINGKIDFTLMDSTGWVKGRRAFEYKLAKIKILKPDLILSFEKEGILPDIIEIDTFSVESFVAKKRDRNTRINFRSKRYMEFLRTPHRISLDLRRLRCSTQLLKGDRLGKDSTSILEDVLPSEIVYVEKSLDCLNIFTYDLPEIGRELLKAIRDIFDVEEVNIYSENEMRGLVVGLYSDRYLGFGLIERIDFEKRAIDVLTSERIKESLVSRIEFGEFRLDENYREIFLRR